MVWSSSSVSPQKDASRGSYRSGEQNALAEDMYQAVNYLLQELYFKDIEGDKAWVYQVYVKKVKKQVFRSWEFCVKTILPLGTT